MKSDVYGPNPCREVLADDPITYEPEDCDECGCPGGDMGDEDWDSGHYKCPDCGAVV